MDPDAPVTRPFMMGPPAAASMPPPAIPDGVQQPHTGYSVPGVLQFIKQEFNRFERERSNWEVERAELQSKIAFLQGERKGHDNLMHDLVRRIKMLEFALKQERNKVYKLTHEDSTAIALKAPELEPASKEIQPELPQQFTSLTNQKESRHILRDYLREVGFPDNILEARVARLNLYRTLMSGGPYNQNENIPAAITSSTAHIEGSYMVKSHPPSVDTSRDVILNGIDDELPQQQKKHHDETEKIKEKDQAVVSECFEFLKDQDSDDEEDEWEVRDTDTKDLLKALEPNGDPGLLDMGSTSAMDDGEFIYGGPSYDNEEPTEEEETERRFIRNVQRYEEHKRNKPKSPSSSRPSRRQLQQYRNQVEDLSVMSLMGMPGGRHNEVVEDVRVNPQPIADEGPAPLGIGDLVTCIFSIANPPQYVMSPTSDTVRKWEHKYSMRSHFDVVTDVKFHPKEDVLFSSSEDCTVKLWTIPKSQNRRLAIVDVEPAYTFRGHSKPVLSIAISPDGETLYSGGMDGQLRIWQIPTDLSDPFDVYDPDVQRGVLEGHTDAIWNIVVNQTSGLLTSCSADGQCILWDPINSGQLNCITSEPYLGSPTCIDFVQSDQLVVVSYTTAKVLIYDVETSQPVVTLDSAITYDGTRKTQINKVLCHPTLPLIITAHENKYICFFDSKTGQVIHSMTAHMDAVTGLAIDPHGLYVLSGSHDGSLRFWSVDTKTCVQEITAHRKRFDESIYNVTCHLTKPYFASAGADSIAKVLV